MGSIGRQLSEYLLRINHYETMTERLRQKIAENHYFQPETVFERMDKFKKGYLIPDDLAQFMLENKIYPSEIELYLIFRDFDKERAGVVTLLQLSVELLPKEKKDLHQKANTRRYYSPGSRLEMDLEYLIARFFEHKLKEIKELSTLRLEMFRKQNYSVQQAFLLLDHKKRGYLERLDEIDQILRANGRVTTQEELSRIFRVLSFDKSPHVTYDSFEEHLDPLGKGYYIGYSQRVAEKHLVHQGYLRSQLEIKQSQISYEREHFMLRDSIIGLQESNSRLVRTISMQEEEQRLREEELLACRLRRRL